MKQVVFDVEHNEADALFYQWMCISMCARCTAQWQCKYYLLFDVI